ncbi:MAG: hypothetical protein JKY50_11835 [Oleispira sp.]|nr:hypothetical protein [Oleispira sp.]
MDTLFNKLIPAFFYILCTVLLISSLPIELAKDGLITTTQICIALATAWAAFAAMKSAKAARDSADQWRSQKKYDLEVDALLNAILAVEHWKDLLRQGRDINNHQDANKLISIFTNQSDIRCQRHEKKHDDIATAWIKAKQAINKANHLGFYEESSWIDLNKIHLKYTAASSATLYAMHEPSQHREKYDVNLISIAFATTADTFGPTAELAIANFIVRYTEFYKKLTNTKAP